MGLTEMHCTPTKILTKEDLEARLKMFREIKDDWPGSEEKGSYNPEDLDWLEKFVNRLSVIPYMYPLSKSYVCLEWGFINYENELMICLENKSAEWLRCSIEKEIDEEKLLDLNEEEDCQYLLSKIEEMELERKKEEEKCDHEPQDDAWPVCHDYDCAEVETTCIHCGKKIYCYGQINYSEWEEVE